MTNHLLELKPTQTDNPQKQSEEVRNLSTIWKIHQSGNTKAALELAHAILRSDALEHNHSARYRCELAMMLLTLCISRLRHSLGNNIADVVEKINLALDNLPLSETESEAAQLGIHTAEVYGDIELSAEAARHLHTLVSFAIELGQLSDPRLVSLQANLLRLLAQYPQQRAAVIHGIEHAETASKSLEYLKTFTKNFLPSQINELPAVVAIYLERVLPSSSILFRTSHQHQEYQEVMDLIEVQIDVPPNIDQQIGYALIRRSFGQALRAIKPELFKTARLLMQHGIKTGLDELILLLERLNELHLGTSRGDSFFLGQEANDA